MTYREGMRPAVVRSAAAAALLLAGSLSTVLPTAAAAPVPSESGRTADMTHAASGGLARFYNQSLTWRACRVGFCARLTVPLSYADPDGPTTTVPVARTSRATGNDRLGSLLLNPGGPGASGISYAYYAAYGLASAITSRYDIIGFDSRGVEDSTPITCMNDRQTDLWVGTDTSPDTRAEERVLIRRAKAIGARCTPASHVARVGTQDTARDMDILRAALGDSTLTYIGYSYGTYLGALYADLFPDRVGRLVLDGVVDPSISGIELAEGQSHGFQKAIRRFVADCVKRTSCPLPGGVRRGLTSLDRFLEDLDGRPLPTGTARPLTQPLAVLAVLGPMYSGPYGWSSLRSALSTAMSPSPSESASRGSALLSLADSFSGRSGDGTYPTTMQSSFLAIGCYDLPATPRGAGLRRYSEALATSAGVPVIARSFAWGNAACSYWPDHSSRVPSPVSASGSDPILVIGTDYDPATPVEWATSLDAQLESGVLVTWKGDGHTAFGRGSQCVDDIVTAYLVSGATPADGTRCR